MAERHLADEVRELAQVARELGVSHLRIADVEIVLGPEPACLPTIREARPGEVEAQEQYDREQIEAERKRRYDEVLFGASGA